MHAAYTRTSMSWGMFHVHNEKKRNSSVAAQAQSALQNPRRRLLETSRLASLTRARGWSKIDRSKNPYAPAEKWEEEWKQWPSRTSKAMVRAARRTPPRRRGKGMRRDSVIASQHLHQRRGDVLFSISTPGSRRRFRSSIVTSSRSRRSRPTVALGSRVQVVEQAGPTQFLSHTSSAPAGMESTAEPARAAARVNA